MKKLIATIAFVLWLIPLVSAQAQRSNYREQAGRRSVRPGAPMRGQTRPADRRIVTASHPPQEYVEGQIMPEDNYVEGPYVEGPYEGEVVNDGGYVVEGDYYGNGPAGCDSCGGGGCESCNIGANFCDGCHAPARFCICFPNHGWVNAEYLLWFQSGMDLPPLVTTSATGTGQAAAGVLPGATILFGNGQQLTDSRSGFRIRFGFWLSNFPGWAVSGEYTGLGEETESFFQQSTGDPILARPFFNVFPTTPPAREAAQITAFPGVATGSVAVDVATRLDGAAVRFRRQLCYSTGCGFSEICCQTVPTSSRLDGEFGYRYWQLTESLRVREQLQSQVATDSRTAGSFDLIDTFDTRNQFNGFELGFNWQGRRGWWSMDALMQLGIGNVHQTVTIAGSSSINDGTTTTNFPTGILAQRTNIGTFDRDVFTMVPELGVNVGYQLTKRWRATMGYSLVYWGNVVRPGDQVDLDLNPNLFAPEAVPAPDPFGALRPQFNFVETDYWVQGLSFGAECRW